MTLEQLKDEAVREFDEKLIQIHGRRLPKLVKQFLLSQLEKVAKETVNNCLNYLPPEENGKPNSDDDTGWGVVYGWNDYRCKAIKNLESLKQGDTK